MKIYRVFPLKYGWQGVFYILPMVSFSKAHGKTRLFMGWFTLLIVVEW